MPEIEKQPKSNNMKNVCEINLKACAKGNYGFLSVALVAGIICFIIYLKTLSCGFVGFDDTDYVLNNINIRSIDSNLLTSSFAKIPPNVGIWIPLKWVSLAIDYHFWGLNPVGYHLTNIILHSANVMLLVLIADLICRKVFLEKNIPSSVASMALLLAGLLFGIHPLRVESVAWVTERKDVLNGLFTFSSILFYLKYVLKKNDVSLSASVSYYILSLFCFLFSLMSKPVSVVLPVIMLVLDWYPLHRFDKTSLKVVILEKIPYFLIAVAVTLMTLFVASGKGGLLISLRDFPFFERIAVSGNALFEYIRLIILPFGIVQYDPLPAQIPYSFLIKCLIVMVVIVAIVISRSRILIATTLCFLLPLLPTLALFQNNDHAYAARYTYLPSAMPSIVIAVSFVCLCCKRSISKRLAAIPILFLLFYAGMTLNLISVWKDTGTYWSRIIEVKPMGRAYQERGLHYFHQRKLDLAITDFSQAIEIAFGLGMYDRYNLNAFRGEAYRETGQHEKAVEDFTYAISIAPRPVYYYHRGLAFKALGRLEEADEDFSRAGTDKGPIEWY